MPRASPLAHDPLGNLTTGTHVGGVVSAYPPTFLHQDYLGSIRLATVGSGVQASKGYHAFGSTRTGSLPSQYGFTAQAEDATGLVYLHARYYDPTLGQFISPDSIVPNPENLFSYNRYLYARADPLSRVDPTGHQDCGPADSACWEQAWQWKNRWYNAHGYFWGGQHWTRRANPDFADEGILDDTVAEAGISWATVPGDPAAWTFARKVPIATGIVRLGNVISGGMGRLRELVGGYAEMVIATGGSLLCNLGRVPCSMPTWMPHSVVWPAEYIDAGNGLAATTVHELAHVIDWQSGRSFSGCWKRNVPESIVLSRYGLNCDGHPCIARWERWAEAVQAAVFGQASLATNVPVRAPDVALQADYVRGLLGGWYQP